MDGEGDKISATFFFYFVLSLKKPIMSAIIETVISPDNFPSVGEIFLGGELNSLNWELILFVLCDGPFDLFLAVKNLEISFFNLGSMEFLEIES